VKVNPRFLEWVRHMLAWSVVCFIYAAMHFETLILSIRRILVCPTMQHGHLNIRRLPGQLEVLFNVSISDFSYENDTLWGF